MRIMDMHDTAQNWWDNLLTNRKETLSAYYFPGKYHGRLTGDQIFMIYEKEVKTL
jgi:hypothetical protein